QQADRYLHVAADELPRGGCGLKVGPDPDGAGSADPEASSSNLRQNDELLRRGPFAGHSSDGVNGPQALRVRQQPDNRSLPERQPAKSLSLWDDLRDETQRHSIEPTFGLEHQHLLGACLAEAKPTVR